MGRNRQYSKDEIAAALATLKANGGQVRLTSRTLGIPEATLRKWRDAFAIRVPEDASAGDCAQSACAQEKKDSACAQEKAIGKLAAEKINDISSRLGKIAWRLTGMLPKAARIAMDKGQVSQIATAVGIALDKKQLLEGKPTGILQTDVSKLTNAELRQRLDAIRAVRAARPVPSPRA
jgi:transposase-like protein